MNNKKIKIVLENEEFFMSELKWKDILELKEQGYNISNLQSYEGDWNDIMVNTFQKIFDEKEFERLYQMSPKKVIQLFLKILDLTYGMEEEKNLLTCGSGTTKKDTSTVTRVS